jgi:anti-sigma B factor antagonist
MPESVANRTLTLNVELKDSAIVVRCQGWLVMGTCSLLYDRVRELLPGSRRVILDLTELSMVDSMGIGTLVRLYVSAKSAGSQLQLINLGKQVREVLGITNLLSLFCELGEHGVIPKL